MSRFIQDWSPEDLDTLRAMWAEGKTAREIGAALGRNRNSIIGKAHRLKLPKHKSAAARMVDCRPGRVRSFPKQQHKRLSPMELHIVAVPDAKPVPLSERTGCCYPVTAEGPHLFCDAKKSRGDYCEFHFRVMYPSRRAA